jgi:deoxyadenosine/deoxycytidine kinase
LLEFFHANKKRIQNCESNKNDLKQPFLNIFGKIMDMGKYSRTAQLRFALKNFGRISSDLGKLRQFFSRRICCADSPISSEKNNYCVQMGKNRLFQESFQKNPPEVTPILYMESNRHCVEKLCAKEEK